MCASQKSLCNLQLSFGKHFVQHPACTASILLRPSKRPNLCHCHHSGRRRRCPFIELQAHGFPSTSSSTNYQMRRLNTFSPAGIVPALGVASTKRHLSCHMASQLHGACKNSKWRDELTGRISSQDLFAAQAEREKIHKPHIIPLRHQALHQAKLETPRFYESCER